MATRGLDEGKDYNKAMTKRKKGTLLGFGVVALLLVFGKFEGCWYMESFNRFTLNDVCKIKKGMHIYAAWSLLGRPTEYQNYDFSNIMSAQYRSGSLFVEIQYTPNAGTVTDVFIGRGRTTTLTESGACSNIRSQ